MEPSTLFNINKICRVCMEEGNMISIYCSEYAISPLDMIVSCTSIKIATDNDVLPTSICSNCIYRLEIAYHFKQQCENSDMRLRECFGRPILSHIVKSPQAKAEVITTQVKDEEMYAAMNTMYMYGDPSAITSVCPSLETGNIEVVTLINEDQHIKTDALISRANCLDADLLNDNNDLISLANNPINSDPEHQFRFDPGSNTPNDEQLYRIDSDKPLKKRSNDMHIPGESQLISTEKWSATTNQSTKSTKKSKKLKVPDQCPECGKTFSYYGYLESHMRIHTGQKPFHCHLCKLKFAQVGNLTLHLRVHTRERLYQCEICSKLFTTSSNLKAHQRIHSDTKDHTCQKCERAFRSLKELVAHAGTHTGVKNHVCKQCNKAFYKISYLNVHVRTVHKGEKRYRCPECSKEFSNSSNLNCHVRIHTGEKPYSCKFCSAKFNQSSALMRHSKQHNINSLSTQNDLHLPVPGDVDAHFMSGSNHNALSLHDSGHSIHIPNTNFKHDVSPDAKPENDSYGNYTKHHTHPNFARIHDVGEQQHVVDFPRVDESYAL